MTNAHELLAKHTANRIPGILHVQGKEWVELDVAVEAILEVQKEERERAAKIARLYGGGREAIAKAILGPEEGK